MQSNKCKSSCGNTSKRFRTANYSMEEKNKLMTLVNNYKHIIENKKTDAVTNTEKEETWHLIADTFNAAAPQNVFRDVQSLKKAYTNIKMQVRKEVASDKVEIYKTGGGQKSEIRNPLTAITLDTINSKTVYGLPSSFDSDAIGANAAVVRDFYHEDVPAIMESESEEIITLQIENEEEEECMYEKNNSWRKWKAIDLKQPLNPTLKSKMLSTVSPQAATVSNTYSESSASAQSSTAARNTEFLLVGSSTRSDRRRPAVSALHSSELSKIYYQLGMERLDIAKKENESLKRKLERENEIHKLKCEILKVELKLKIKELEKINDKCA